MTQKKSQHWLLDCSSESSHDPLIETQEQDAQRLREKLQQGLAWGREFLLNFSLLSIMREKKLFYLFAYVFTPIPSRS